MTEDGALQACHAVRHATALQSLSLYGCPATPAVAQALAACTWPSLKSVGLLSCQLLDDQAVEKLSQARWPSCTTIQPSGDRLGDASVLALATSSFPLRGLRLSGSWLTARGMAAICRAGRWRLTELYLTFRLDATASPTLRLRAGATR